MRRKRRKAWLYFLIGYVYTFIKFINDKSVQGINQTKLTMTMTVILKMVMIVTVTMMVMRVFFEILLEMIVKSCFLTL